METTDGNISWEWIEQLKQEWLQDPCWDLEDTEGFEEFRTELLAFRLSKEAERKQEREIKERARYPLSPAFSGEGAAGLTKREYFAALALQGLLTPGGMKCRYAVRLAVEAADLLIEELRKE